jgi:MazG family protein
MKDTDIKESFAKVVKTMEALRRPETGCKWDRAQTHESIIKNMREEAEEAIVAIQNKDDENLKEELGDVLLQVLFHCAIAQEENRFDIGDVIENLNAKLIRRHPHVFAGARALTPEDALAHWEEVKKREKAGKD